MQQPPLPHMEPMKPTPPPQAAPAKPQPAAPVQTKGRLRQFAGYVGGASLGFVLLVCAAQLTLKPGLRPTDMAAMMEAQTELGVMNQRLGYKPGDHILSEDEYRKVIAQAEREGQAKAEIEFQRELAEVQADREIVVQAYGSLYQRANMIAQAAIQLESLAQQFRQQLLTMSNGGRSMVIGVKDLFCGLGSPEACQSAHDDRRSMISESDELSRGDVGERVRELMADVPDPATFIVRKDARRHGAQAVPER